MVPATCVPWPLQSPVPRPSATAVHPAATRPPNSVCPASTPVSITYALTPAPDEAEVKEPDSGSARWSMRSRPHGAGCWVSVAVTGASISTVATCAERFSSAAWAGVAVTTAPRSAFEKVRPTAMFRVRRLRTSDGTSVPAAYRTRYRAVATPAAVAWESVAAGEAAPAVTPAEVTARAVSSSEAKVGRRAGRERILGFLRAWGPARGSRNLAG